MNAPAASRCTALPARFRITTHAPRRLFAIALALIALIAGAAARADQFDRIRAAGVLRVAMLAGEPPLSFVDPVSHEFAGYEADIAGAIAGRIGVRLQPLPALLAERIPMLRAGNADLVIAQLTITRPRAELVDFSIPYYRSFLHLLVRSDDSDRIDNYATGRLGADRGSTQQDYLAADFPAAHLVLFDDAAQALQALRDSAVDGIVQDALVLAGLLRAAPDRASFKILPDFLTDERIAVGIAKSEPKLLDAVNAVLLALEQSGEAARIYHAWFDPIGPEFHTRDFIIEVPCGAISGWSRGDCHPSATPP